MIVELTFSIPTTLLENSKTIKVTHKLDGLPTLDDKRHKEVRSHFMCLRQEYLEIDAGNPVA